MRSCLARPRPSCLDRFAPHATAARIRPHSQIGPSEPSGSRADRSRRKNSRRGVPGAATALRGRHASGAHGDQSLRHTPLVARGGEHARCGPPVVNGRADCRSARRHGKGRIAGSPSPPIDPIAQLPLASRPYRQPRRGKPVPVLNFLPQRPGLPTDNAADSRLPTRPSAGIAIACAGPNCAAAGVPGLTYWPFSRTLTPYGK